MSKKANDARLIGHQMLLMMPSIGDCHALARVFLNKIINTIFARDNMPNVILMILVHLFSESYVLNIKKLQTKSAKSLLP